MLGSGMTQLSGPDTYKRGQHGSAQRAGHVQWSVKGGGGWLITCMRSTGVDTQIVIKRLTIWTA